MHYPVLVQDRPHLPASAKLWPNSVHVRAVHCPLALAKLLEHMHKNFEINGIKIKGGCQLGRSGNPQF